MRNQAICDRISYDKTHSFRNHNRSFYPGNRLSGGLLVIQNTSAQTACSVAARYSALYSGKWPALPNEVTL